MTVRKHPSGKMAKGVLSIWGKRIRKQFATKGSALSHERCLINYASDLLPVDQLRLLLATSASGTLLPLIVAALRL
jgi:hypothetical protein